MFFFFNTKMNSECNTSFHVSLLSGCSMEFYPGNTLSKFTVKLPVTLKFSKNQWEVCVDKIAYTRTKENEKEHANYNYVCVYSDIIKPVIIGSQLSRALLMRPLIDEEATKKRTAIIITNKQYCQLESSEIAEINILITDETGEQINFIDDSFQTMIRLHFRKMYKFREFNN